MKRQAHVFYEGRVQGVGFRYTAEEMAQRHGIVGWVRNRRDGRVELVAQGEDGAVRAFLDDVRTGPLGHYIRDVDISWSDPDEDFPNFDIRPTA
ncbi:MAG: acylphosphatase [Armatimonadota bacterium]|nr:acylphosphatase [Armatimonadota bacterium]